MSQNTSVREDFPDATHYEAMLLEIELLRNLLKKRTEERDRFQALYRSWSVRG